MNDAQILEKIIAKVLDRDPICFGIDFNLLSVYNNGCILMVTLEATQEDGSTEIVDIGYKSIIFNHAFAKSLWGEEKRKVYPAIDSSTYYLMEEWQYHLQQMVLEKYPLEYLKKFI